VKDIRIIQCGTKKIHEKIGSCECGKTIDFAVLECMVAEISFYSTANSRKYLSRESCVHLTYKFEEEKGVFNWELLWNNKINKPAICTSNGNK
jgi:hypothetical protein